MDSISSLFQPKKTNERDPIDLDEETLENTFCSKCLTFPEYFIRFSSESDFSLFHSCLKGEITKKSVNSENKSKKLKFKCHYCEKECENVCIKCKYVLCEECFSEHNRVPLLENINIASDKNVDKYTFMNLINIQYFCGLHLRPYNFYCPLCKINMCDSCKKRHIHINCINILEPNIKGEDIIEPSDVCFKKLYKIAKIFQSCYDKSIKNSKMSMNILLNNKLANNIIEFIRLKEVPSVGKEIKNNYLINIDQKSYLCKKYDDPEFNAYYRHLIMIACRGNIIDYYRLYEIGKVYNVSELPNNFDWGLFHDMLELKVSNFIYSLEIIIGKYNISEMKLNLSKCFKKISNLIIINKLNEFSIELLKAFSLKMNYKLDFELRRKVGNILGQLILQKYHENINTIKPTKYLLTLSSEKIAEDIASSKNRKKYKSSDSKKNGNSNSLKSKFISSLNMLINTAQKEINEFDYENAKSKKVVITFKSLNNEEKEINKAIIFNLFFYIKKKFGDEFNFQIHNTSHSINSIIAETINNYEAKEEKKNPESENKDNTHSSGIKVKKNGIQSSESKNEENKNEIIIHNNKICSNIYKITEKLDNSIKVKEKFPFQTNYNLLTEDEDSIIKSSVNEFAKTLEKMKSTFSTSVSISLQQSLDLYIEGNKGKILEKVYSSLNLKDIIHKCIKNQSNNNELNEVKNFCDEFEQKLDDDLDSLYPYLSHIVTKIGEVAQIFNTKELFDKYGIKQPVDLIKAFTKVKNSIYNNNYLEEIYYLIHVISYFLVISNIKALNKIKDEFNKIALNKLIENNIIKEKMVSEFMKEVDIPGEDVLNLDVWNHIKSCKVFIEDKEMNERIIHYVETKSINDYKNDLYSLLEPHAKNINLDGRDPQNIFLDSFMKQNELSC